MTAAHHHRAALQCLIATLCAVIAAAALVAAPATAGDWNGAEASGKKGGKKKKKKPPWIGNWQGGGVAAEAEPFTVEFVITKGKRVTGLEFSDLNVHCDNAPGSWYSIELLGLAKSSPLYLGGFDILETTTSNFYGLGGIKAAVNGHLNKKKTRFSGHLSLGGDLFIDDRTWCEPTLTWTATRKK
jgi:hypothetical protein